MKYAIMGAGIGGLTTALAFEQQGIDYELFERVPKMKSVGAGIWLAPNALKALESLGVLEDIKANGNSIDRITVAKSNLSPLSDTPQEFIKNHFGYSTVAIHRGALQKVLLSKIPTEKIHLGKSFKGYSKLDSGSLKVDFEDGSSIETDYLIGADGINSGVRKQLFPESEIRYTGQTCWRGIAEYNMENEFEHWGMELWGPQFRFGLSKVAEGKVYWFAVALANKNEEDDKEKVKGKLLNMYMEFHPLVGRLIEATPTNNILRNDINDLKPMPVWHKDRVALIGDAGHATTPNMGQGGAQAIEDAYHLSRLIEKLPHQEVFEAFLDKRKDRVNKIVSQSWSTGKMAHMKFGKGIRNLLLKSVPQKLMQKKMIEMYTLE